MKGNNSILHHDIIYLFCCERDNLIHFVAVRNFFFLRKSQLDPKKRGRFYTRGNGKSKHYKKDFKCVC